MQHIDGLPLGQFVEQNQFTIPQTLELVAKTCRAVAYAHQRGIIHRDLKPSNVMVDSQAEPHVLDFGLAKPAGTIHGSDTLATQTGEFFGTLAYASPEQVSGKPDTIDTRTDTYAIGVILYELLTGRRPYRVDGSMTETLESITEIAPKKPSRLKPEVGDELDTIISKALAKDADRRYQSADALADDIDRYLTGRPIHAKSDSGWYVTKKLIGRHRAAVSLSVALVVAIIGFAGIVTVQTYRIADQRDLARIAERDAASERDIANAAKVEAQAKADALRKISYFQRIALASNALETHNYARMFELLDQCPDDLRNWEWHRLHRLSDRSLRSFQFHNWSARPAVHPASNRILVPFTDGRIEIRETTRGETTQQWRNPGQSAGIVEFSPKGNRIACADRDGFINIRDVNSAKVLLTFKAHAPMVSHLSFSPDADELLVTASNQLPWVGAADIAVFDTAAGHLKWKTHAHHRQLIAVAYVQEGSQIAAVTTDGWVMHWDVENGTLIHSKQIAMHHISAATFVANPDRIITADSDDDRSIAVWAVHSAELLKRLEGRTNAVSSLSASLNGKQLLSGADDGAVKRWDLQSGLEPETYIGHQYRIIRLAFLSDGDQFLSISTDGQVRIWDPAKKESQVWHQPDGFGAAAFSPDGALVVSGSLQHNVQSNGVLLWDPHNPASPPRSLGKHHAPIDAVAFSPDGQTVLSAGRDRFIHLWRLDDTSKIATLAGHTDGVTGAAFLPDGRHVASGSWDHTCRIWELDTHRTRHVFDAGDEIWDLACSPDGTQVALGTKAGNIHVWDPKTGQAVHVIEGHQQPVDALAYSPDGTFLISGGFDGKVCLWDAPAGQLIHRFQNLAGLPLYCATFSPDGRRIAVAGRNRISLWDTDSGQLVYDFRAHDTSIYSIAFSPDGRDLLSASADGTFKLWPTSLATKQ
jgi:WD40 repeat protein